MEIDSSSLIRNDGGQDDGVETIGSRLRKRRRTGSSPAVQSRSSPRRPALKKSMLPHVKQLSSKPPPDNPPLHIDQSSSSPDASTQYHSVAQDPVQDSLPQTASQDMQNGQRVNDSIPSRLSPQPSADLPPENLSQPPNLATIIANIIEHGEAIERRYLEMGQVDTEGFTFLNASHHLKLQSLPILDNLVSAWVKWRCIALKNRRLLKC